MGERNSVILGGRKACVLRIEDDLSTAGELAEDGSRVVTRRVIDNDNGRGWLVSFEEVGKAVADERGAVVGDDGHRVGGRQRQK